MDHHQQRKSPFVPIGMMEVQQIEWRIRRSHSQYMAENLMQLVKSTIDIMIKLAHMIFSWLGQRKQMVR